MKFNGQGGEQDPIRKELSKAEAEGKTLEKILEEMRRILAAQEAKSSEIVELSTIIEGLCKKTDILIAEDKAKSTVVLESEEEYNAHVSRRDRIQKIYELLSQLDLERDNLDLQLLAIEGEFEMIDEEAKRHY